MLRKYKYILVVLLSLLASGVGHAQDHIPVNPPIKVVACPQRKATVNGAFDTVARDFSGDFVGMCLGAIGPNGAYAATKCYGEVLIGSHVTPTNQSFFWIGSITKTMTATRLALRVNQGSVQLDDRVDGYLPSAYDIPKITLLQLADMESGLPREIPYQSPADETQLYTDLQTCVGDPSCWKGVNRYIYSNFGFAVLGNVLASRDGAGKWSRDNYSNVMVPLGMFDTKVAEDFPLLDFLFRRTIGHRRANPNAPWTVSLTSSQSFGGEPAGGLWSTPKDMLIWLKNATGILQGNNEVDAALNMTMQCRGAWGKNNHCASVQDCGRCTGLAWTEDIDQCTGGIRISKSGSVPGFSSWIGFDKATGRGVFVLLNTHATDATPSASNCWTQFPENDQQVFSARPVTMFHAAERESYSNSSPHVRTSRLAPISSGSGLARPGSRTHFPGPPLLTRLSTPVVVSRCDYHLSGAQRCAEPAD